MTEAKPELPRRGWSITLGSLDKDLLQAGVLRPFLRLFSSEPVFESALGTIYFQFIAPPVMNMTCESTGWNLYTIHENTVANLGLLTYEQAKHLKDEHAKRKGDKK